MFTQKRKQIGPGALLVIVLSGLYMMFHNLAPPAVLLVAFIAIVGIYLIWTKQSN